MKKYFKSILLSVLVIVLVSCTDEEPMIINKVGNTSAYIGSYRGVRSDNLTNRGVITSTILSQTLSLRSVAGVDTFNILNPATNLPMTNGSGTWFVAEAKVNGNMTRTLRLILKTSSTVTSHQSLTVREAPADTLKLENAQTTNLSKNIVYSVKQ